ncbi:beta-2-microglobulin-like, partial [Scleropages formosus]
PPRVSVYSRNPGEFGKENKLICHTSHFYPPNIVIKLMKNNKEIGDSYQTDLTFNHDWHFQLTKTAPFIPEKGNVYTCEVMHDGEQKVYSWGGKKAEPRCLIHSNFCGNN